MAPDDALTCEETIARLADFVDRELTTAEAALVALHLAGCEDCTVEFRFEQAVLDDLRRKVQAVRMPDPLRERLWTTLRSQAREPGGTEQDERA